MKIKYYLLTLLFLALGFNACKNNDDTFEEGIDERDRATQQIADKDTLIDYLGTHYYNSGDFVSNLTPSINDLVITELLNGETLPANHTLLIDDIIVKNSIFLDVNYEYYILELNKGGGDQPHFTDKVRLNFSGNQLDGQIFDSSSTPIDFDLVALIPGWSRVIPEFNVSESFIENGDGTVSFTNPGVGVMFLPSGLAYFSDSPGGDVPVYASLIFKFELYQTEVSDHDLDGIPSYVEDLDNDFDTTNDDTDENFVANFVDPDDDGDGVFTFDELEPTEYIVDTNIGETEPILAAKEFEISRSENEGVITINTVKIVDSNNDGLDDYLDENITINYNEES